MADLDIVLRKGKNRRSVNKAAAKLRSLITETLTEPVNSCFAKGIRAALDDVLTYLNPANKGYKWAKEFTWVIYLVHLWIPARQAQDVIAGVCKEIGWHYSCSAAKTLDLEECLRILKLVEAGGRTVVVCDAGSVSKAILQRLNNSISALENDVVFIFMTPAVVKNDWQCLKSIPGLRPSLHFFFDRQETNKNSVVNVFDRHFARDVSCRLPITVNDVMEMFDEFQETQSFNRLVRRFNTYFALLATSREENRRLYLVDHIVGRLIRDGRVDNRKALVALKAEILKQQPDKVFNMGQMLLTFAELFSVDLDENDTVEWLSVKKAASLKDLSAEIRSNLPGDFYDLLHGMCPKSGYSRDFLPLVETALIPDLPVICLEDEKLMFDAVIKVLENESKISLDALVDCVVAAAGWRVRKLHPKRATSKSAIEAELKKAASDLIARLTYRGIITVSENHLVRLGSNIRYLLPFAVKELK